MDMFTLFWNQCDQSKSLSLYYSELCSSLTIYSSCYSSK